MKITEALIRLEAKQQKLLEELQDIKMHVYALEEENQRLRAKLFNRDNTEGRENLLRLYGEGFHVCPMRFGDHRDDEDCLFCHTFLNKLSSAEQEHAQ